MNDEINQLEYALCKQIPDMERGFNIETNYGYIEISNLEAPKIIKIVREILEKELAELQPK
jgi:hypothetical protein